MAVRGKPAKFFNIDLEKFGKVTTKQAEQIFWKITLDLDRAVILDTPVLEGRLRGNWYPSVNFRSDEVDVDLFDKQGTASIGRLAAAVFSSKLGDTVWLSNNVDYSVKIENGGSPLKAPDGMVEINVVRFAAKYGTGIVRS